MKRVGLAFLLVFAPITAADVSVSVEITGTVDELVQILEVLQSLGIGTATISKTEAGLPINLHSLLDRPLEAGAPEEAPPPPPLAFLAAQTTPEEVRPGNEVLITLEVSDPDRAVDTVVATRSGADDTEYDLFDNGKRGDAVAYDGIWSLALPVPPDAGAGTYILSFMAYDEMGEPVYVGEEGSEDRRPLTLRATFEVVP
jgi:hypothetical protein